METFVFITVVSIFMFQMGDIYGDILERDLRKLRLSRSWFLFTFFVVSFYSDALDRHVSKESVLGNCSG